MRSVIGPILKLVLRMVSWNLNAFEAYSKIDDKYKDHMLVKSPKKSKKDEFGTAINTSSSDEVINYNASLHYAIKVLEKKQKQKKIIPANLFLVEVVVFTWFQETYCFLEEILK